MRESLYEVYFSKTQEVLTAAHTVAHSTAYCEACVGVPLLSSRPYAVPILAMEYPSSTTLCTANRYSHRLVIPTLQVSNSIRSLRGMAEENQKRENQRKIREQMDGASGKEMRHDQRNVEVK